MTPALRRILLSCLPVAISLLCLAFLFMRFDLAQAIDTFSRLSLPSLVAAVALIVIYYVQGALRLLFLVRPVVDLRLREALALNFSSALMAHAVGILIDGMRIAYLARAKSAGVAYAAAASFADRLLSVWLLAALLCLSALCWHGDTRALMAGAVCFLLLLAGSFIADKIKWPAFLRPVMEMLLRTLKTPRLFIRQFSLSAGSVLIVAGALWILAAAMQLPMGFAAALTVTPAILLGSVVPFTYAGLGTREAAAALVLPMASALTHEQAVALSLALGVCLFVSSLPGAFLLPLVLRPIR